MQRAQSMVCDEEYQNARVEITGDVSDCMSKLIKQTKNKQNRATDIFEDMYLKLEIGIVILALLMLFLCVAVKRLIVKPLLTFEQCIIDGKELAGEGSKELQELAITYNQIYLENEETQKLIC